MIIEEATEVTDELEAAFVRLMPQLSSSNPAPTGRSWPRWSARRPSRC